MVRWKTSRGVGQRPSPLFARSCDNLINGAPYCLPPGSSWREWLLQRLQERAVYCLVAGHDRTAVQHALAASLVGDETARLAYHQYAGGHVPGRQPVFPKRVHAASCYKGESERGGTHAADSGRLSHHIAQLDQVVAVMAASKMRHAGAHQRVRELAAAGDT